VHHVHTLCGHTIRNDVTLTGGNDIGRNSNELQADLGSTGVTLQLIESILAPAATVRVV
jgi:hypothetical protein